MRVTNQMTSNSLLLNLNRNAQKLNTLNMQLATGSKIQVASENPIVAALALKFRTNVSETIQYDSNVKQATSWMDVTGTALGSVEKILERTKELCIQAGNETNTQSDREDMIKEIGQLREQLVSESNATYAGRYIFGGYKTDREVMFSKDIKDKYNITQKFNKEDIETIKEQLPVYGNQVPTVGDVDRIKLAYENLENLDLTYTDKNGTTHNLNTSTALDVIKNTPPTAGPGTVTSNQIGYDPVTNTLLLGTNVTTATPPPTVTQVNSTDKDAYLVEDNQVKYISDTGELIIGKSVITSTNGISQGKSSDKDAYVVGDSEIKYLSDTGELVLGKNASNTLKSANDITLNYDKDGFKSGDLNPEQYFDCKEYGFEIVNGKVTLGDSSVNNLVLEYTPQGTTIPINLTVGAGITPHLSTDTFTVGDNEVVYLSDTGKLLFGKDIQTTLESSKDVNVSYEKEGLIYTNATIKQDYKKEPNDIKYEFGVNNKMKINVEGSDVFTSGLIKSIDDLLATINGATPRTEEQIKSDLEKSMPPQEYKDLVADKDALAIKIKEIQDGEEKVNREVVTDRIGKAMTKIENHKNNASTVNADLGARVNRLNLVEDRLGDDYVNYTELMAKNEGIEFEKVYIEYMSQQAIYDSALKVGAQIIQKSLVDFI